MAGTVSSLERKGAEAMAQVEERPDTETANDGRHDFDFLFGTWYVKNRKRVRPLVQGDDEWIEFEGQVEARPILGGVGNIDTFKAPDFPGRPGFEGFTLRLFEPETGLWRIWWASSIGNGEIDPPVVGRFRNGLGRFVCEEVIEGVPVRVRYDWKDIRAASVTWEQSFSFDNGETWDPNWIMKSTRIT
jgi:hypothetical protein